MSVAPSACVRRAAGSALRPLALVVALAAGACTDGPVVDLGRVERVTPPASGATSGDGAHVFIEAGAGDDAPALFAAASDAAKSDPKRTPVLVYPSDETMLAPNVAPIRQEWTAGDKNRLFELELAGPNATVRIYTTESAVEPSPDAWHFIAQENAGGTLSVSVRGLDPKAPAESFRSAPTTLSVSARPLPSSVYYWSTGLEGVATARISDTMPQKFYPDPTIATSGCAGCHALSRDGSKLAVIYEGEALEVVSIPDHRSLFGVHAMTTGMPDPMATDPMMKGMDPMPGMMPDPATMTDPAFDAAWAAFSPDGTELLVSSHGSLRLLSATSGEPIGDAGGVVALPDMVYATHPDWSPRGDRVAITLATKGSAKEIEGGAIAVLPYADARFGEPTVVAAPVAPDDNAFFPSFSPDGRYIAYVEVKGNSRDAEKAALRLLDTESGTVFDLPRLNQRVNNQTLPMPLGNSMPVFVTQGDAAPPFFLAFSSLRAYASVRPADKKVDQLFLAAIDPSLADPGYPAFWAPFQSLDQGNHRAFFSDEAPAAGTCCAELCGNGIDDDCDGVVDEPACTPACEAHEICGDGIDNDCNCVVDDCATHEICDDGIDNDGDGLIDLADPACALK